MGINGEYPAYETPVSLNGATERLLIRGFYRSNRFTWS